MCIRDRCLPILTNNDALISSALSAAQDLGSAWASKIVTAAFACAEQTSVAACAAVSNLTFACQSYSESCIPLISSIADVNVTDPIDK